MFNNLGWGEILTLAVFALVLFGPDRMPGLARDAAKALKKVRHLTSGAREQLKSELGPEFGDIDFTSLNPRTFVRKHLLEDGDEDLFSGNIFDDDEPEPATAALGTQSRPDTAALATVGATPGAGPSAQEPLDLGELAPYDADAT